MKVVQRSPGFVLEGGGRAISMRTYLNVYEVVRVEGDQVVLAHDGKTGIVLASEVIPVDLAVPYFTRRLEANPRDAFSNLMRALCREFKKEYDGALADCDAAIQVDPRNGWALSIARQVVIRAEKGQDQSSG